MIESFPLEYTLESGTRVIVNQQAANTYQFLLNLEDGDIDEFTYVEDGRPKSVWDEQLNFEQLEALRTFWLKNEEVV